MEQGSSTGPLVSVTLPLASDADPVLLGYCLRAVEAQTYGNIELLVLICRGSSRELDSIAESISSARLFDADLSKSAARNFLARKANGRYMLYIDVDQELTPSVVEECVDIVLNRGLRAIFVPPREISSRSLLTKCRLLETELLSSDPTWDIPTFLEMSTFFQIGGFDESIDILDDIVLSLKLKQIGVQVERVQSHLWLRASTNLRVLLRRKFDRGRAIPSLIKKFPNAPNVQLGNRIRDAYLRNWRRLLSTPLLSLGLISLKILEYAAFSWGRMHPASANSDDGTLPYLTQEMAQEYDRTRLGDNFNRFKHFAEVRAMSEILPDESAGLLSAGLLEVGCGTGRMTEILSATYSEVVAIDPSPSMLSKYLDKPNLPKPIRASGIDLPFGSRTFDGTVSLRVIWHLPTEEALRKMLAEMARVSSKFMVLDIANEDRWQHPVMSAMASVFFMFSGPDRKAHKTSQMISLNRLGQLSDENGYSIEKYLPLDALFPVWLNLLPSKLAEILFPILYRLEKPFSAIAPPGRYLVRMTKSSRN